MKTYFLMVSRHFPTTHKRKGDETYFVEKIGRALGYGEIEMYEEFGQHIAPKLHTIRANYLLWRKRFDEIEAGKACLSLRYWGGKPYRSKQVEFLRLTKDDGIGLQKILFCTDEIRKWHATFVIQVDGNDIVVPLPGIAENDGLSFEDFREWFKGYDLSETMALIHFTDFRY